MELLEKVPDILEGLMAKPGSTVPTFPIILGYSINEYHNHTGIPAPDIMRDGDKIAEAQIYIARRFNIPFVITIIDLNVIGEAFGATLTYMPDVIPVHEHPAIEGLEGIDDIEPKDPRRDGRMPQVIKAAERFGQNFSAQGELNFGGCEGPITAAGSVWGVENLMRNMIKNPNLVHKVLAACTDTIIDFCNAQIDAGVQAIGLAEPTASSTCISPQFFQEFAVPYLKKITRKVNSPAFLLHVCGESQKLVKLVSKITNILIFSVDQIDLRAAKEELGKKFLILLGNVSTGIMRRGTIAEVEAATKACIGEAMLGGKFILSTGCDIAPGTPPENIETLIRIGRTFGKF
ncbi:MAG: uroporphyrinogen decarboxylase family protein [Candidatus Helarchaeota archaeon]|nr:uroporphyrinogen decarboxylase family protein [Candidatus Helarchaeota archaeon]